MGPVLPGGPAQTQVAGEEPGFLTFPLPLLSKGNSESRDDYSSPSSVWGASGARQVGADPRAWAFLTPDSFPPPVPAPAARAVFPLWSEPGCCPGHALCLKRAPVLLALQNCDVRPSRPPSPAPSPGLCPREAGRDLTLRSGTYLCSTETIDCIIVTLASLARQKLCGGKEGPSVVWVVSQGHSQGSVKAHRLTEGMKKEMSGHFTQLHPSPKLSLAVL